MTKKERIEYYKLVEPKLRAVYISNGYISPSEEEFQELNLTKKNREEFLNYFKDNWFNIKHFSPEDTTPKLGKDFDLLEKILGSDSFKNVSAPSKANLPKLQMPSNSALFQISRNIDVKKFHHHLQNRDTFIAVHKETGVVTGGNVMSELSISFKNLLGIVKKDPDQYEIFEIEDHAQFCKLLEDGNFKKIKKGKLFADEIFDVPNDYPLSTILKRINLYEFADALNENKPLIKYDFLAGWYSSFDDVNAYHSFNATYNEMLVAEGYKPIDRTKETDTVWFYAENPLQIRQEILFGNFKILKKIKVIENIFEFFM